MRYKDRIDAIAKHVAPAFFGKEPEEKKTRVPTQASSEFLTNREQGEWGERVLLEALNASGKIAAVRYGVSDRLAAGEKGFKEFYEKYASELRTLGKRPDILLFRAEDYDPAWGQDISGFALSELDAIVPKAIAGLEVRTSLFRAKQYRAKAESERNIHTAALMEQKARALSLNAEELPEDIRRRLEGLSEKNAEAFEFRVPNWKGKEEAKAALKGLRAALDAVKKRSFLSFTPKTEDLIGVKKWIDRYGVPHFYVQVFYDEIFCIGFEDIMGFVSNPKSENKLFFVERDVKNQMKTTIKIDVRQGVKLGENAETPVLNAKSLELASGRVIPHVRFDGGRAAIDFDIVSDLILKALSA